MSAANEVPETWELSGDDAWETLKRTGRLRLAGDAFRRFRAADGTSHARSLAFLVTLLLVQGVIALVAVASVVHHGHWSDLMTNMLRAVAPGPAGKVFTDAVDQAHTAGASHNYSVLLVGLVISSLITACSLMGQVERGLNRLYGIEQDRPTLRKYGRALALSLSAGTLIVAAFAAIAVGHVVASSLGSQLSVSVWNALRWPVGLLLAVAGIALFFRWSPYRHQPAWSWLTFGAIVAVALWMLATIGLSAFFRNSSTFGKTYGSLAGLIALLLWSFVTSVAVFYGGAVAAQLEAIRAGVPAPLDPASAPDAGARDREMAHAASKGSQGGSTS
jgi:YihY family inner membrane protein